MILLLILLVVGGCIGYVIAAALAAYNYVSVVTENLSELRTEGAARLRFWCVFQEHLSGKLRGHQWRIVRYNDTLIEDEELRVSIGGRPGIGWHTICEQCGEEWDCSELPPLSPLEELALRSK